MRTILFCLLMVLLCLTGTAYAQTATDFPGSVVGVNAGFCQTCDPQVNGGAWYAKRLTGAGADHPTYSFTIFNVNKVTVHSLKPVNVEVMTTTETGFAQHVMKWAGWDTYALAYTGPAADNSNVGLSYGGGSMALHQLKGKFLIGGYFRAAKQTIAKDIGWQVGLTLAMGGS